MSTRSTTALEEELARLLDAGADDEVARVLAAAVARMRSARVERFGMPSAPEQATDDAVAIADDEFEDTERVAIVRTGDRLRETFVVHARPGSVKIAAASADSRADNAVDAAIGLRAVRLGPIDYATLLFIDCEAQAAVVIEAIRRAWPDLER